MLIDHVKWAERFGKKEDWKEVLNYIHSLLDNGTNRELLQELKKVRSMVQQPPYCKRDGNCCFDWYEALFIEYLHLFSLFDIENGPKELEKLYSKEPVFVKTRGDGFAPDFRQACMFLEDGEGWVRSCLVYENRTLKCRSLIPTSSGCPTHMTSDIYAKCSEAILTLNRHLEVPSCYLKINGEDRFETFNRGWHELVHQHIRQTKTL